MNKFSRQLHNEIANNFKVHQDVNHFEVIVKYSILDEINYDFGAIYSALFGAAYSFKDIIRALKKSNTSREFDNNYKSALAKIVKGDYSKVIEHEDITINVLKDVYDMIAVLDEDAIKVIDHVRSYEKDLDTLKTFLISYLKNESHPSLDFKLLQKVCAAFKENYPKAFQSLFSKARELSEALGAGDLSKGSYRAANDKEGELTKKLLELFNSSKEDIISVVNDLKNVKGGEFVELYDLLTNKLSKQDVEDACRVFVFYLKKAPALRVLGRFSLPAIANRFDAIDDASFDKLKSIVNKILGDKIKKELFYEVFGNVHYQVSAEIEGSLVEIEEIYKSIKETGNKKHLVDSISAYMTIPFDECAKINASVFAFLLYVHAGDPEKAIRYYLKHREDDNNIDLLYKTLDLFYNNIEKNDDELRVKLLSSTGDVEKQMIAANLLFYSLSLSKNGFDPSNNEIVKQYEELVDVGDEDKMDIEKLLESEDFEAGDLEADVEYFRNALMVSFKKYLDAPNELITTNFNSFASKIIGNEDAPEFMKEVIEDLSATQISLIIRDFDKMLEFYPNFKKCLLIFIMEAVSRNFSVIDIVSKAFDDPNEILKIREFIEISAPVEKKDAYLRLAGLGSEDSQ